MSLCKTIQGYDSIYIRKGYDIDCACTELDQRHQALFHIQEILKNSNSTCKLDGSCFACGINKNTNYTCAYQTITTFGPNNLMATLDLFDYCYNNVTNKFSFRFGFTVTFSNPSSIITLSFIDISLNTVVQPITTEYFLHPFGSTYRLYGTVPNAGLDMYTRIRITDGISNIDFPIQEILEADAIKYPCLSII